MNAELKTASAILQLSLSRASRGSDWFRAAIGVQILGPSDCWRAKDVDCHLHKEDACRLIRCLEDHVQALLDHERAESPVYVPSELGFQIRCLDGDVESRFNGYFTIEVLVNHGIAQQEQRDLYLGFASTVDLVDLNGFIASLKLALAEMNRSRATEDSCS